MTDLRLELKSNIDLLQTNQLSSFKTKINLGNEFYMQAKVYVSSNENELTNSIYRPDTSRIFVNIGLGFHVEFTLPEALEFVDKKERTLTKYVLHCTCKCYLHSTDRRIQCPKR